jgi:predicted CXXCH cytochrome family protein
MRELSRAALLILLAAPGLAATYTGASACQKCHAAEFTKWQSARHSKMIQTASAVGVKGDFNAGKVSLRGDEYLLRARGGVYYITESKLRGTPWEHRVDYTLGSRRIQHYLTRLPDGRIIVLAPSWDVLRKQWFHNFDIGDPDESGEVEVQLWNKQCFSCHVSQEQKGFDTEKVVYDTTWTNFGTNCERCHGPGSDHVKHYSAAAAKASKGPNDIVLQTRLTPERNTMVCAQCHSFRDIFIGDFAAGDDYYSHFMPILEYDQPVDKDPAYWADGRTRRFSNDALGLWQSKCFLKGGATCVTCHTDAHDTGIEHNTQLRADANALCTHCHESLAKNLSGHTHHAEASAGSSCIECHMPRTVQSIKAEIRDHSITIPAPENTLRHQIPNACNNCHKDREASWAAAKLDEWFGPASRRPVVRLADAFAAARTGDSRAVPQLIEIASDPGQNPLARANATGYLSRFPRDPAAFRAMMRSLSDPHPLVRSVAALRMLATTGDAPEAVAALTHALGDSAAVVRLAAAVNLVGLGVKTLPGEDGARFEEAKKLYQLRARLNDDDAGQQLSVGRFYLMLNQGETAAGALNLALHLDPQIPAQYYLAYAYAELARYDEARAIIAKIPASDPQFAKAQELYRAIAGH